MDRRGFLAGILALGVAPAIVRAESLMRVSGILVPSQEVLALSSSPQQFVGDWFVPLSEYHRLTRAETTRELLRILDENLRFVPSPNIDLSPSANRLTTVRIKPRSLSGARGGHVIGSL